MYLLWHWTVECRFIITHTYSLTSAMIICSSSVGSIYKYIVSQVRKTIDSINPRTRWSWYHHLQTKLSPFSVNNTSPVTHSVPCVQYANKVVLVGQIKISVRDSVYNSLTLSHCRKSQWDWTDGLCVECRVISHWLIYLVYVFSANIPTQGNHQLSNRS